MMVKNMTRFCVWVWFSYWWRFWIESFWWSLWGFFYWSLILLVFVGRFIVCYIVFIGILVCLIRRDCWICCGICGKSFFSTVVRFFSLWIFWDIFCWKFFRFRRKRYYKCISYDVGKGIMKYSFLICI